MKVCKYYDLWCKGEKGCEGCKHNNEKDQIEFKEKKEVENVRVSK